MCTENMVRMPKMSSSNCLLYIYMKKKKHWTRDFLAFLLKRSTFWLQTHSGEHYDACCCCCVIMCCNSRLSPAGGSRCTRGDAGRVSLSRWGQLTDSSQSQGEDGLEPPYSVVPWELSRFWLWSIREGSKGGYACTMPNKTKKDKVSLERGCDCWEQSLHEVHLSVFYR